MQSIALNSSVRFYRKYRKKRSGSKCAEMEVDSEWTDLFARQLSWRDKHAVTGLRLLRLIGAPRPCVMYLYAGCSSLPPSDRAGTLGADLRQLLKDHLPHIKPAGEDTLSDVLSEFHCRNYRALTAIGVDHLQIQSVKPFALCITTLKTEGRENHPEADKAKWPELLERWGTDREKQLLRDALVEYDESYYL